MFDCGIIVLISVRLELIYCYVMFVRLNVLGFIIPSERVVLSRVCWISSAGNSNIANLWVSFLMHWEEFKFNAETC